MFKKIIFILKNRFLNKSKISLYAFIKNPKNITIEQNVEVHSNSSIDAAKGKITLKNNTILNRYSYLNAGKGSIIIGEGSEINNFTVINGMGDVIIGKNVLIGPNVQIIPYNHNFMDKKVYIKKQGITHNKIVIEDDVWIGASSIILAGVTIKKGSVVACGSIVNKDTLEYSINIGSPSKFYKERK
ncbi:MAG TPA: acyltransferase [Arcobacter sp.]|nr:acyltransferase [Arcobacter sp.]